MKCLICLLAIVAPFTVFANFSGTVVDSNGVGKQGVKVKLVNTRDSTQTDAFGKWALKGSSTSVIKTMRFNSKNTFQFDDARLHLKIAFNGYSILGRKDEDTKQKDVHPVFAQRSLSALDTLIFVANNRVFWMDTVSISKDSIKTTYDTTWTPAIYGILDVGEVTVVQNDLRMS